MGAWIEIRFLANLSISTTGRTPRWVRGLKWEGELYDLVKVLSHPTMGAWIEMNSSTVVGSLPSPSHPTMGAWIEISVMLSHS